MTEWSIIEYKSLLSHQNPALLIALGFLMMCGLLVVVAAILSSGAWGKLARKFPAAAQPQGAVLSGQSVGFRRGQTLESFSNIVTIGVGPTGVFIKGVWPLSMLCPPLLIPWSRIGTAPRDGFLEVIGEQVEIGLPEDILAQALPWLNPQAEPPGGLGQTELSPGERLVWRGRPVWPGGGGFFWPFLPISLFGLLWSGFAAFFTYMSLRIVLDATNQGAFVVIGFLLPLGGVVFLLIGLALIAAPKLVVWFGRRGAENTEYMVTDRRFLIVYSMPRSVVAYEGAQAAETMTVVEHGNGTGDILFGCLPAHVSPAESGSGGLAALFRIAAMFRSGNIGGSRRGFIGVPDVRSVESLVRDAYPHPC